jgi:MoaA/NifB/PqqE/SkfB family radical SAM enzyme
LVKIRGDQKKPLILFHFTGTRDNIHELPKVLRLAKEIGVDVVEAQDTHFWGDEKLKDKIDNITLRQEIERAKKIVNECMVEAKKLGIRFDWLGSGGRKTPYSNESQLHADQRLCQKIFRSCFITVDGYVTTCASNP